MIVRYRVGGVGRTDPNPGVSAATTNPIPPSLQHSLALAGGFSDNETIMVRLSFTGCLLQLPRVMGSLSKPTPISPSFRPHPPHHP